MFYVKNKLFFYCDISKILVEYDFNKLLRGVLMDDNFNKHLGNKLKLRRLALGLTQTKVAKAINVTFQQIQKYEKGTNGVSSIRLLQLANYLKVQVNYFFEDFSEYLINLEKSQEGHINVNYNFLIKLYSELNGDQKLKFTKALQLTNPGISKVG
jgi:transcriptional regulator with XRE-family HTH domain